MDGQKGEEKIDIDYFIELRRVLDEEPSLPVALRALNYEQEKKKFLRMRENPVFRYHILSAEKYENRIKIIKDLESSLAFEKNESLKKLYLAKTEEMKIQLELRQAIGNNTSVLTKASELLWDKPNSADFKTAVDEYNEEKELRKIVKNQVGEERKYDAKVLKLAFERAMEIVGIKEFRIVIEPKAKWITINTKHKEGYCVEIPPTRKTTIYKLEELIAHEIVIHLGRGRNGQLSKLKLIGFTGADHYGATEEGMATFSEQRVALRRGRMPKKAGIYATLALGAALEGRNFRETFDFLKDLGFSEHDAWKYTYRVFRGISDTAKSKGKVITLDWNYRQGNLAILRLVEEKGEEILDSLYVGKIGIHHLEIMKELHITTPKIKRKYLTIEELLPELV
jgi:hypothetical protein